MSDTKQSDQFFLDILIRSMRACILMHPQDPLAALNLYPSRIKTEEELLAWSIATNSTLSKPCDNDKISVGIVSIKDSYNILKNNLSIRSDYDDIMPLIAKLALCDDLQMIVAACDVPIESKDLTFQYAIKSICTFADMALIQNQYTIDN